MQAPFRVPARRRQHAMSLYADRVLPRLVAWAMRAPDFDAWRARLVPRAQGRVVEVGVGSGPNLRFYGPGVERVIGLDPSAELLRRAAAAHATAPVHLLRAAAEAMPLGDGSMDSAVMTWTLCSVADQRASLAEIRRVLRPGGTLLFVEHGLAPDARVAGWQKRLDPVWWRISCHLDTPVERLLAEAGFTLVERRAEYPGGGPKALAFMTEGVARRD